MDGPDCLKPIPLEAPSRASCSLLWLLPCLSASRSKSENQINTPASISSSRFSFPIVLCSSRIPTPTLSRPVAPPPRPPPPPLPTSFSLSLSPGVAACLPGPGAAPRGALPGRRPRRFGARRGGAREPRRRRSPATARCYQTPPVAASVPAPRHWLLSPVRVCSTKP